MRYRGGYEARGPLRHADDNDDVCRLETRGVTPTSRAVALAILAVLLLSFLCVAGLSLWLAAPVMAMSPGELGLLRFDHLAGLLIFELTLAPLIGATVGLALLVSADRWWFAGRTTPIMTLSAVLALTGIFIHAYTQQECGWFICSAPPKGVLPQGEGFRSVIALVISIICLGLSLAFSSGVLFRALWRTCATVTDKWKFSLSLCFIIVVIMVASQLPPLASAVSPRTVAEYIRTRHDCGAVNHTTLGCFELPTGLLTTFSINVAGAWMTWTPPRVVFLLFACCWIAVNFVIGHSVTLRLRLRQRFRPADKLWASLRLTVGEVAGWSALSVFVLINTFYWISCADYGAPQPPIKTVALAAGHLAATVFSLLIVPVNRLGVVHAVLGIPRSTTAHRWMGNIFLLMTLVHVLGFSLNRRMNPFYWLWSKMNSEHWDVANMAWIMTFVAAPSMVVLTSEAVRRRSFELFRAAHLLAAYALIPAILWHAYRSWDLMLPALLALFFDRLSRISSALRPVVAASASPVGEAYVKVEIFCEGVVPLPGQHLYINVPSISLLEWHPFTVSSFDATRGVMMLHIKQMGDGTCFTGKLRQLAASGAEDRPVPLKLLVEGPVGGESLRSIASDHDAVVLVAGGIGVTPCASIIAAASAHWSSTAPYPSVVTLIWVCRSPQALAESLGLPDTITVTERSPRLRIVIYDTAHTAPLKAWTAATDKGWCVRRGRPEWREALQDAVPPGAVSPLVFLCGPSRLVLEAEGAALRLLPQSRILCESFIK